MVRQPTNGNSFIVGSTPDTVQVTFVEGSFELTHERAEILANTILAAIQKWKEGK
jgi:hypothetical protein